MIADGFAVAASPSSTAAAVSAAAASFSSSFAHDDDKSEERKAKPAMRIAGEVLLERFKISSRGRACFLLPSSNSDNDLCCYLTTSAQ